MIGKRRVMVATLEEGDFGLYQPKTELVTLLSSCDWNRFEPVLCNYKVPMNISVFPRVVASLIMIKKSSGTAVILEEAEYGRINTISIDEITDPTLIQS